MKTEGYYIAKAGPAGNAIPAVLFTDHAALRAIANPVAWRILHKFVIPKCPIDVARDLGIHEQKIYYYIKKFRAEGLIEEVRTEQRHGTFARFYRLKYPAFGVILDKTKTGSRAHEKPPRPEIMQPFITNGAINSIIVVGSPDPHGPWKARASDSCCAIDLALFFGSFVWKSVSPNYKLDVEIRDADLKKNLILVGGPMVNMITHKVNEYLPLYFDIQGEKDIISKVSGKSHTEDECGVVEIIENPWNPDARILVLAGRRFAGTRAAVIAWIKHLPSVQVGQKSMQGHAAKVVRGFDMDGDGVIDSAEIIE